MSVVKSDGHEMGYEGLSHWIIGKNQRKFEHKLMQQKKKKRVRHSPTQYMSALIILVGFLSKYSSKHALFSL